MTIRYDNLHVTVERGQAASTEMLSWLTSKNINTVILTYTPEDIADALYPLSTWFVDDSENKIIFDAAPVLVFDQVLWEAEDGSDAYRKRMYVTDVDDLPEDFLKFVEKVS